jgi:hypothetical protein
MKKLPLSKLSIQFLSFSFILLVAMALPACNNNYEGRLTVTEEIITLPTYLVDPPNPMPRFFEGRAHQG